MKITVKLPRTTHRHWELFCKDTPYKQKIVRDRTQYQRHAKHKGAEP
jgi:hypothetical protein